MIVGAMNNPHKNILKEVGWIARNFDFVDLTLEHPKAFPTTINIPALKKLTKNTKIVGHLGWYLPIGSPFLEMRKAVIDEFELCAIVFSKLGVEKATVHINNPLPLIRDEQTVEFNIWTLRRLVTIGKRYGVQVMGENTGYAFSSPTILGRIFKKVPGLLFNLDIAHANIGFKVNQTPLLIKKFSKKIAHVHISGNKGRIDEHLSIRYGNIRWKSMLKLLKNTGYDGTITLEVFNSKQKIEDKRKLKNIWETL